MRYSDWSESHSFSLINPSTGHFSPRDLSLAESRSSIAVFAAFVLAQSLKGRAQNVRGISCELSKWLCGLVTGDSLRNMTGPDPCF